MKVTLPVPVDDEGRFDGATLLDGRGYRTLDGVEHAFHERDRLSLILRKPGHFVVQYLGKVMVSWKQTPVWDALVPDSATSSLEDAERLATAFVSAAQEP